MSDTAADRLRAFEDEKFGSDAVRINGKIERGYGSKFKEMSEADAKHYAALEALVVAEQNLADANAAQAVAQEAYDAALKAVDSPAPATDADKHAG